VLFSFRIACSSGSLLVWVLLTCGNADGATQKYRFGKERVQHYFCSRCGSSLMAESIEPGFYEGVKALNVWSLYFVSCFHFSPRGRCVANVNCRFACSRMSMSEPSSAVKWTGRVSESVPAGWWVYEAGLPTGNGVVGHCRGCCIHSSFSRHSLSCQRVFCLVLSPFLHSQYSTYSPRPSSIHWRQHRVQPGWSGSWYAKQDSLHGFRATAGTARAPSRPSVEFNPNLPLSPAATTGKPSRLAASFPPSPSLAHTHFSHCTLSVHALVHIFAANVALLTRLDHPTHTL
jgi:hypothetical protein